MPGLAVYFAAGERLDELLKELGPRVTEVRDRLVLAEVDGSGPHPAAWAQNVWLNPRWIPIESIGDGARKLKEIQRNWALWSVDHHRRARLIQDKLPHVSAKPLEFGQPLPSAPLGCWTLWEPNLILASPQCSEPVAHGRYDFVEDHENPPGRAYLKLWETFTRLGLYPQPGQLCLDLGASPGGWTWVLAGCGARVVAIDKASLADNVAAMPGVEYRPGSAFGLEPRDVATPDAPVDWLCSDVICYPERLLALVRRWLDSGLARNFVCTLKFQGETDFAVLDEFRKIENSRLLHLWCNKHELTWVKLSETANR